jgi:SAM-dependent methyltransferase
VADDEYILTDIPAVSEFERLGLLEQWADPFSWERLEAIGVASGWRCLEVGAGAGSTARWLAEKVGPSGTVVATDIDTRHLTGLPANVEVHGEDIRVEDPGGGPFDLAHCRQLLIHMIDPAAVLARMVAALRPGGWLFVEEADAGLLACSGHPDAGWATEFTRKVLVRYAEQTTMDLFFGRRLPPLLIGLGLEEVEARGLTRFGRGSDLELTRHRISLAGLRERSLSLGFRAEDWDRLTAVMADPGLELFGLTLVGAWGRKRG